MPHGNRSSECIKIIPEPLHEMDTERLALADRTKPPFELWLLTSRMNETIPPSKCAVAWPQSMTAMDVAVQACTPRHDSH